MSAFDTLHVAYVHGWQGDHTSFQACLNWSLLVGGLTNAHDVADLTSLFQPIFTTTFNLAYPRV